MDRRCQDCRRDGASLLPGLVTAEEEEEEEEAIAEVRRALEAALEDALGAPLAERFNIRARCGECGGYQTKRIMTAEGPCCPDCLAPLPYKNVGDPPDGGDAEADWRWYDVRP